MIKNRIPVLFLTCIFSPLLQPRATAAMLSGVYAVVPSNSVVDLSAQGTLDWVHWGLKGDATLDRKANVLSRIETFAPIIVGGGEGPYRYDDNANGYSWSDGSPTSYASNSITGLYIIGKKSGFRVTVPADTRPRRLKVYVGAYGARAQLTASLSDASATEYSDSSIENVGNGPSGVYTIDFAAGSAGQTLTITYTVSIEYDHKVANVTLQAATLTNVPTNSAPARKVSPPSARDKSIPSSSPKLPLASVACGFAEAVFD
jgi:hypothetical protein